MTRSKRATREEWAKRVAGWRASGLTAKAFAEKTGAKASTLRWWACQVGSRGARAETRPGRSFVEVVGPLVFGAEESAKEPSAVLEVLLSRGLRVRVPVGFEPETLRRLVDTLEGR